MQNPYFHDMGTSSAFRVANSPQSTGKRLISFDKLRDLIDDLQDTMEFLNELFE